MLRKNYIINKGGGCMIIKVNVKGFKEDDKLTLKEKRKKLVKNSELWFSELVDNEREKVLSLLMSRFSQLRYEDLEEVYNDGCLVLWNKMNDKNFQLADDNLVGYLLKICKNIGMHYERDLDKDIVGLDSIMEVSMEIEDDENGLSEVFDVIEETNDEEERYEKLEKVWEKLKEVDRMILVGYYVDGNNMEEIAKKVGYKNGDSVKSRKKKLLDKLKKEKRE